MKMYEKPPPEISHSGRKLKLLTSDDAPFWCNGWKEPGYGLRYTDNGSGGQSFDLHTC